MLEEEFLGKGGFLDFLNISLDFRRDLWFVLSFLEGLEWEFEGEGFLLFYMIFFITCDEMFDQRTRRRKEFCRYESSLRMPHICMSWRNRKRSICRWL